MQSLKKMVGPYPVGYGRNPLGAAPRTLARRRCAPVGPDRLQPHALWFQLQREPDSGAVKQLGSMVYEPERKDCFQRGKPSALLPRPRGRGRSQPHLLTTSTSEAYSFLFRLLCDPGDEILIGQPGYPLFDFLAQLDDIRLIPYSFSTIMGGTSIWRRCGAGSPPHPGHHPGSP